MTSRDPILTAARAAYAREICRGIASKRLESAFAKLAREDFVGPGPWQLRFPENFAAGYQWTPDADPRHLYQNVLVALDASRGINNGHPSSLAAWLDRLALEPGDHAAHIGCGVGYYSAVMAELVGTTGELVGVECDDALAERATHALGGMPQAAVYCADGSAFPHASQDAIFASAGATSPVPWLAGLAPGGRLLLPLTVGAPESEVGVGWYLLVTRCLDAWAARFVSPVGIFHCVGARTELGSQRLSVAYRKGGQESVRSLRLTPHREEASCWLHDDEFCLSREPCDAAGS